MTWTCDTCLRQAAGDWHSASPSIGYRLPAPTDTECDYCTLPPSDRARRAWTEQERTRLEHEKLATEIIAEKIRSGLLLTKEEVAQALGLSDRTIERRVLASCQSIEGGKQLYSWDHVRKQLEKQAEEAQWQKNAGGVSTPPPGRRMRSSSAKAGGASNSNSPRQTGGAFVNSSVERIEQRLRAPPSSGSKKSSDSPAPPTSPASPTSPRK